MSIAYVFPGQGSQTPGMGEDLYDKYDIVKEIYHKAKAIAGFDVAEISFSGDMETLAQTQYTQPCLYVHSRAIIVALGSRADFSFVAGHSLGEYSALFAAHSLSFEDGCYAVVKRGQLMSEAKNGGMIAPLGSSLEDVEFAVDELKNEGIINIANYNAPGQYIVSGEKAILNKAAEILKQRGAKKIIPLPVSGAFHSQLMLDAQNEMKKILDKIEFNTPRSAFYSNVSGTREDDPRKIRQNLILQITNPVRWIDIIENMTRDGAQRFVEIGPGKVLQGLIKRISMNVEVSGYESIVSE